MNLENTLIMKLTDAGLCLWKRFDGSYFEAYTSGKAHEICGSPEKAEEQKETQTMKISDCM